MDEAGTLVARSFATLEEAAAAVNALVAAGVRHGAIELSGTENEAGRGAHQVTVRARDPVHAQRLDAVMEKAGGRPAYAQPETMR